MIGVAMSTTAAITANPIANTNGALAIAINRFHHGMSDHSLTITPPTSQSQSSRRHRSGT
jgi:hypothetical protein